MTKPFKLTVNFDGSISNLIASMDRRLNLRRSQSTSGYMVGKNVLEVTQIYQEDIPTRATWHVYTYIPFIDGKRGGRKDGALIEAYEEIEGRTIVEFSDGFEIYLSSIQSTTPIGDAFRQLCEELVEEWGRMISVGDSDVLISPLKEKIIEAVHYQSENYLPNTDQAIANRLSLMGVINPKTGEAYSREHINRLRNQLRKSGYKV